MTLKNYLNEGASDYNFNSMMTETLINTGEDLIRQLINSTIVYSKGNLDAWGEAYIDATGRSDSVNTTTTTAFFDTNFYELLGGNITSTGTNSEDISGSAILPPFSNVANDFDGNLSTFAETTLTTSGNWSTTAALGKTFSTPVFIHKIFSKCSAVFTSVLNPDPKSVTLETYDGVTWTTIATLNSGTGTGAITFEGYADINATVYGVRVRTNIESNSGGLKTSTHDHYELTIYDASSNIIVHTIPTGTFASNISQAIGIALIKDYETGNNIEYKFTNATEDSGWLPASTVPIITRFNTFTSEPTTLTVRISPTTIGTPTSDFPRIYGFCTRATSR